MTSACAASRSRVRSRARLGAVSLAVKIACGTVALAELPTGGAVVTGAGQIGQNGNTLTVHQQTARMGVEWETFNIGTGQRVQFVQPGTDSVALNRVIGSDGSKIMGSLDANGKVFLVNPNGVVFSKDAQVNTGGLVASTLGISNEDFLAGRFRFTKDASAGSVANAGRLTSGSVVLIAPTLENTGSIDTHNGNATLAAGDSVTVSVMNNGLITASVDKATLNGSIRNSGAIRADGGSISLQAGTADAVLDAIINTDGLLQARSVQGHNGRIFLGAGAGGTTYVDGTVDASGDATGQTGGEITALGKNVALLDGATLDVAGASGGGTVLVGGNWQGLGPEHNATAVVMSESAVIKADATDNGNGGKVVLWSDEYTNFAGAISARGGSTSGNGGKVETSARNNLRASGSVDASAVRGTAGEWLLDPSDVYINNNASNGSFSGSDPRTFTPVGNNAALNVGTLTTSLNGGTSVIVTTSSAGSYGGNIYVDAPITKSSGGDATLTLRAIQHIFLRSGNDIISTAGKLHVVLQSRASDSTNGTDLGAVWLEGTIKTNGGDIKIGGGPSANSYAYNNGNQAVLLYSNTDLDARGNGGGNISLNGRTLNSRGVEIGTNAQIRTNGTGTITISGTSANSGGSFGVLFLDGAAVSASQGAVSVTGQAYGDYSGIQFGDLDITTTSGAITLTGSNPVARTGIYKFNNATVANITSTSGLITLSGSVPSTSASTVYSPIHIHGGTVTLTTGGSIILNSSGGISSAGIELNGKLNLRAGTGIDITHSGSAPTYALYNNGSGTFTTTSGDINLTASRPFYMPYTISSGGGNVTIAATSSSGTAESTFGAINSGSGSGNIDLRFNTPVTFNGAITGGSGDISIAGNDLTFGATVSGSGTLALMPYLASASIGLGGGAGTLQLPAALFSGGSRRFADGFSSIVIGRSTGTAAITVGATTVSDPLTLLAGGSGGSIRFSGAVAAASNDVTARARGNITLDSTGSITGQNLYVATDGGNFVNNRGASALNASGRWLVYANSPTTNTYGSLASGNKAVWNQNFDTLAPISAPSGNRYIFSFAPTGGTISGSLTKVYGDTSYVEDLSIAGAAYANTQGGMWIADTLAETGLDTFTLAGTGLTSAGLAATANAGTYTVSLPTAYTSTGYAVTLDPAVRLEVLRRALTVTAQADSRVYDGTTSSSVAPSITAGSLVNGNTANWVQVFSNKNAGSGKTLTASGTVSDGNSGNNYAVTFLSNTSGSIQQRDITVTAQSVTKTYDRTTTSALTPTITLGSLATGDTAIWSQLFADKNVGTDKTLTASGTIADGNSGNNYNVTFVASNAGVINKLAITAAMLGNASKVYDGTTSIGLDGSNFSLTGALSGDTVSVSNTAGTLVNKMVGTGKNVSVASVTLGGADAGNYLVSGGLNANIGTVTAKALTAGLTGSTSKEYDRTTDVALTGANYQLDGIVSGDVVTLNNPTVGTLDSKNVGAAKNVGVGGLALSGSDAVNYTVNITANANIGTVTTKALTASLTGTATKTYDGTTDIGLVAGNYGLAGVIGGDAVTLDSASTGTLGNKNVGTGKAVTIGGLSLTGADAGNYTVNTTANAAIGVVNAKALTASLIGSTAREYDATTSIALAGANYQLDGVISGETVNLDAPSTGTLDTKNVGTGKNVAVTGLALSGGDAGNYTVNSTANANIVTVTAKALTATLTGSATRVYDGTTDIALTGANYDLAGVIAGDVVDLDNPVVGTLDDRNAGTAKSVAVSGLAVSGADAGNYTVNTSANANMATVTKRGLVIGAVSDTRTYDRTNASSGTVTLTGLVAGDSVAATQSFNSALAGSRTLSVDPGFVVADGNGGNNYDITTSTASGTIDRRSVVVSVNADDKEYDGTTVAHGTVSDISGVLAGDNVVSNGVATFAFADKNVGTGKAVTVSGMTLSGMDSDNYQVSAAYASDASITPATLSVTAIPDSKIYGSADPTLTYGFTGLKGADTAAVFSGALTRASGENVGVYGIGQGTLAAGSNYVISYSDAGLRITPATLAIGAYAGAKMYGDADPSLGYSVSGLVNGDTTGVLTGALARTPGENVGTYAVNLGSVSAGGNYTLAYTSNVFDITRRALVVTADNLGKIYGDVDPALGFTHGTLFNGDSDAIFSGSLLRATGEDVGSYAIGRGTLSAGGNYDLQFTTGRHLDITPRTLTVAANARGKSYGDVDPTLSFTHGTLVNGDVESGVFSGALTRDSGENVGSYTISRGTLSAGSNYVIEFTGNNLDISTGLLVVNANAQSKVYGDLDPTFSYTFSGLMNGDTAAVFDGGLNRAAGENVGNYAIGLGTLSAGPNYTVQFYTSDLAIARKDLNVAANARSKVYGSLDPALTFTHGALVNGDTDAVFSGSLGRSAGENVNTYAIVQDSLSAGGNYTVHYTGGTFDITPATLRVAANAHSKVYGDNDPTFGYTHTGLVNGDDGSVFSGDLTRGLGETVNGGPYAIGQGTLAAGSNYVVDFTGNLLTITPRALLVDVASKLRKTYDGTADLLAGTGGYDWTGQVSGDDLDVLGTLGFDSRNAGARTISLTNLTLSGTDASNYYLAATSATGSGFIDRRAITVAAQADSRIYDGTTTSSGAPLIIAGSLVDGDRAAWSQSFDDRNAGTRKTLNASGTVIDGNDGANYAVTYVQNDGGVIERRAVTVMAQPDSKTFDGTTASAGNPLLTAGMLVGGDTANWSQTFSDASVGTGKTLSASGAVNDGNSGGNYALTFVQNHEGVIVAAPTKPGTDSGNGNGGTPPESGNEGRDNAPSLIAGAAFRALRSTTARTLRIPVESCTRQEANGIRMPERPTAFLERDRNESSAACNL